MDASEKKFDEFEELVLELDMARILFAEEEEARIVVSIKDITDRKRAEEALRESGETVRKKLKAIIEPEGDIGALNLSDIIDREALQTIMEDFYKITKISSGVIDISGKVLVAVGWQDVCTKFHRVHPDTLKNCIESDTALAKGVPAGAFKTYRCKNNLCDMATPIEVDGRHIGNIYIGQFFYEDDLPDKELFRSRARQHGFDETEYLAAIDRVPRWSRETVDLAIKFYAKLAGVISSLSYSTVKLSRALSQNEIILRQLETSQERFNLSMEATSDGLWDWNFKTDGGYFSPGYYHMLGYEVGAFPAEGNAWKDMIHPDDREHILRINLDCIEGRCELFEVEYRLKAKNGAWRWVLGRGKCIARDEQGRAIRLVGTHMDITERKRAEQNLNASLELLRAYFYLPLIGIATTNITKGWIDINPKLCQMLGYSEAELRTKSWSDLTPFEDQPIEKNMYHGVLNGEISLPYTFEKRFIKKDGVIIITEISTDAIGENGGEAFVSFIRDITEKKRTEQALRESEQRYRAIMEQAADAIFIHDKTGRIMDMNRKACQSLGYSREELLSKSIGNFFPEAIRAGKHKLWPKVLAGEQHTFESRHMRKGGSAITVEVTLSPVRLPLGLSVLCIARDITERKQTEKALQELKIAVEQSIDGIAFADMDWNIQFLNEAWARMHGYCVDELIGRNLSIFHTAEQLETDVIPANEHALTTGSNKGEIGHVRKDGTTFPTWMSTTVVGFESPKASGLLGIAHDITERKREEAALQESEENYRSLAASVDSMYLVDRDCTYLFMNEGHRMRFGLPLEEIIGRRYGEFHLEEKTKKFEDCIREVFETGKPLIKESRSDRDGRCFLRTFTPIMGLGPVGQISKVVIVSKDITERKLAEEDLFKAVEQLQETRDMLVQFEKEAAVGRLSLNVAHELLNPASIISSQLQFMEEEDLSEPARENVKISREQIRRIVGISRNLQNALAKKPAMLIGGDLRDVIDMGMRMTAPRINKDNVQVEHSPPPEAIPVKMEKDRLVKVLVNLIHNACDAMTGNQAKRLIITVHRPEDSSKEGPVILTVADNGQGIPAGTLNWIFEPFFTTKDPGKGAGLGLSVSKGIILEHGGTMRAENNDMGGASFIIELPLDHT